MLTRRLQWVLQRAMDKNKFVTLLHPNCDIFKCHKLFFLCGTWFLLIGKGACMNAVQFLTLSELRQRLRFIAIIISTTVNMSHKAIKDWRFCPKQAILTVVAVAEPEGVWGLRAGVAHGDEWVTITCRLLLSTVDWAWTVPCCPSVWHIRICNIHIHNHCESNTWCASQGFTTRWWLV